MEEAIVLHLLEYKRHFGEDTVPIGMTQAGISRAIGVRRSHVSSSLDNAKQRGTVEEVQAHVRGESRRRKCYYLSDTGITHARDLKEKVTGAEISAMLPDGADFVGTLKELTESVNGLYLPKLALLTFDGVTNIPNLDEDDDTSLKGGTGLPEPERLFGREGELAEMREFFDGDRGLLLVKGIPGIGKTALTAFAARHFGTSSKIFWYSITEWSSPRNIARHLAAFLDPLGFPRLRRYLVAHEVPDLADLKDILLEVDFSVVAVFDDTQNSGSNTTMLLKMLASICEKSKNMKIILVGRKIPDMDLKQKLWAHIQEMEVRGLERKFCLELLNERGIPGPEAEAIVERSGGHPLYLTLVEKRNEAGDDDISNLLAREIFNELSDAEKDVLFALSVFRKAVGSDAFITNEAGLGALDNLEKRSIVGSAGGWTMHNLLRDFFYSRQTRDDREARHENAAEYYNSYSTGINGRIEEAFHLFKSRDYESAILLLSSQGPDWLRHGYQDEILQLSSLLPERYESPEEFYEVQMLNASAMDQIGEWENAKGCYEACLDIASTLDDAERRARALRGLGAIHYRKGDFDKALETFKNALSDNLSPLMAAEIQSGIGVVHWRLGQPIEARTAYESDLKISEKEQDLHGLARALNNLGILDWQEERLDDALEKYARALESAERIPDKKLIAILYSNIADVYKSKGEKDEARRFYERCLELSEDLKFNWQMAEAYKGMAEIVDMDRDKYLNQSLQIFERLGAEEDAKSVRVMMR